MNSVERILLYIETELDAQQLRRETMNIENVDDYYKSGGETAALIRLREWIETNLGVAGSHPLYEDDEE